MTFLNGFLVATIIGISIFAYASFEGHLMRTVVNEPAHLNYAGAGDDVPLYDARGHKIP